MPFAVDDPAIQRLFRRCLEDALVLDLELAPA
jgi:hypothetical protein